MAKRDYYEVLEVDKTATIDVIKKAYRDVYKRQILSSVVTLFIYRRIRTGEKKNSHKQ